MSTGNSMLDCYPERYTKEEQEERDIALETHRDEEYHRKKEDR